MLILKYLILAVIVVYASIQASNQVDLLDKKTNIGGALIGGLLLAAITSLPELITSISSVFLLNGEADLAFGNVFGSNVFNLVILAVADIFFVKHLYLNKVSNVNNKSNMYVIFIYLIFITVFLTKNSIPVTFVGFNFALVSIVILILYGFSIKMLADTEVEVSENDHVEEVKDSLSKILFTFALWAVILIIASVFITMVADDLAETYQLDTSFAGALFLGIATSLPEATAVFNLIRLRSYDIAISNIIGSNIFNFTIISFVDVLYHKQNLYDLSDFESNVPLLFIGIINSLVLMYALLRKKTSSTLAYLAPSLIIIANYLIYFYLSI